MKKITIILMFIFGVVVYTKSQISTEEEPVSFKLSQNSQKTQQAIRKMEQSIQNYELDILKSVNMSEIEEEDLLDNEDGIPPRFGISKKVNLTLENSGTWTILENGDKLWQLPILSKGALSMNLLYDKFWLPEGAKFFVYSQDRKQTIGAFTSYNNKGAKDSIDGFATELIFSDKIILEYYQPAGVKEDGIISVSEVIHGYRAIFLNNSSKSFGSSFDCHNNINCPVGNAWQTEKKAVALVVVNGNRHCSGSLLNTTANDSRPVFLTADHCLKDWDNNKNYDAEGDNNLNHWSFYWNYESAGCNNTTEPVWKTTVGAKLLANSLETDFALLKLTEDPKYKNGVNPYYLGWDARTRSYNSQVEGVGIHHPKGDVKKISLGKDIVVYDYSIRWHYNGVYLNTTQSNTHWEIGYYSGTTEGGSSGSPLLNDEKRVIGQLHGGLTVGCPIVNNPSKKLYGRFDLSWLGYNNINNKKTRRLFDWLDPNGTGGLTTNTIGSVLFTPQVVFRTVTIGQTQTVYPLYSVPDATGYVWEWTYNYNSNEVSLNSTNQYASVSFSTPNSVYTLQARPIFPISGAYSTPAFIYNFQTVSYQTKNVSAYPNPVSDILNVKIENPEDVWDSEKQSIGNSNSDKREFLIKLYNASGNQLYSNIVKEGTVQINLSRQKSGLYYLIISDNINKESKPEQIVIVKQ